MSLFFYLILHEKPLVLRVSCFILSMFIVAMVTLMETGSGENGLSLSVVNQSDDDDDCMSTGGSAHSSDFNGSTTDIMVAAMNDDVTAQLAAAGWQKANFNGWCSQCFVFVFNLTYLLHLSFSPAKLFGSQLRIFKLYQVLNDSKLLASPIFTLLSGLNILNCRELKWKIKFITGVKTLV